MRRFLRCVRVRWKKYALSMDFVIAVPTSFFCCCYCCSFLRSEVVHSPYVKKKKERETESERECKDSGVHSKTRICLRVNSC